MVAKRGWKGTLEQRLWAMAQKTDGCWFWKGSVARGYGKIWDHGVCHKGQQYTCLTRGEAG